MYYLLIIIILAFYYLLEEQPWELKAQRENVYSLIICCILVLMAAFRSDAVGADTPGYRYDYESLWQYTTLDSLINNFTIYYIGYFGLSKLFYMAGMPVQVWFGFIEAFYLFALMKLVNRFSRDKVFSLLVFVTIGLFTFSMAGLKQTFAASLMMLAFVYFLDRKYILTVLLIGAVFYTHQAALIFLCIFPLYFVRKTKWFIPMVIIMIGLIYLYGMVFLSSMVEIIGNEKWEGYLVNESDYTYVTFIFYSVITLIAFLYFRNYNEEEPDVAKLFLGGSLLGCGMQLFAGFSPSLFRLANLYTPLMMIFIPNAVYYMDEDNRKIVRIVLMVSIIFYFLYTGRNSHYEFIWREKNEIMAIIN